LTPPAGARPPDSKRLSTAIRDRAITGTLVAVLAVAALVIALPHVATPAPGNSSAPSEAASSSPIGSVVYREGVVGRPTSITPITARTRADRTLVGLIYSGLVKIGPGDTLVPDLADSWSVDKSGQVWTVKLRPGAVWSDGKPVTADDVVFTVSALKDPSAAGGLAATWADVAVERVDDLTVRFTLGAPVGGFVAALTQPLLPSHLLAGVQGADLASSGFALNPVGSGPYQLALLDDTHAVLVPVTAASPGGASPGASGGSDGAGPGDPGASASAGAPSAAPSDAPPGSPTPSSSAAGAVDGGTSAAGLALTAGASPKPSRRPSASPAATAAPTASPTASPDPNASPLAKIEVDFYDTEDALAAAYSAGQIDGASGLTAAATKTLGATAGARVLDYPTTTLSAILLNQRPTHPELADPNVRKALLGAIDRATIASTDLGGQARVADALVPPESWAYDASKVTKIPYDRSASAKLLRGAGWTKAGGKWTAPKAKAPYAIELLTVPPDVNPRLAAVANAVKDDWTKLGLTVTVRSLTGSALATKLKAGDFSAAVLDIASGFEPDLYPLLDSSQVRANGSNRSGYQDPALDKLLEAARRNGSITRRKAAWSALLAGLSDRLPVLPIVWADEQMVVRSLSGNTPRLIVHTGDRFWDVLAWRLAASR
jgi:ABC-type transport system substrate-binding protein